MADSDRTDNEALLAALKHPLRRRILREMEDGAPASPSELAERLGGISLSNVSYHVRVLAWNGALKSVENRQVRGATQHFYRWALDAEWALEVLAETEEESSGD